MKVYVITYNDKITIYSDKTTAEKEFFKKAYLIRNMINTWDMINETKQVDSYCINYVDENYNTHELKLEEYDVN